MTRKKAPETTAIVRSPTAWHLTFVVAGGERGIEAGYADENVGLSQKMIKQLDDAETPTINLHLKNGRLEERALIRNLRIAASDGKAYGARHGSHSATGFLETRQLESQAAAS